MWHCGTSGDQEIEQSLIIRCSNLSRFITLFFVDLVTTNTVLQGKGKEQMQKVAFIWTPPAYDYLKLNTYGSWKAHNEAGGGSVFRGATGKWYMGFSSKFNAITPLAAELYAVREWLLMAVDYDIQNWELETDVKSLLTMLDSAKGKYHEELKPILSDVASLMGRFKSIVVKHCPRGMNKMTHRLAQYALNMAVGHKLFLNPPPFASFAYQGDLQKLGIQKRRN